MYGQFQDFLKAELQSIKDAGLYKNERIIVTPQDAEIKLATGETVLNFCANNYLGLSDHPAVIEGAKKALDARGYGMSSVRFICGTQDIHKELEAKISEFFGTEDTILYAACFDANGGVFEPLFGAEDAIIKLLSIQRQVNDAVDQLKAEIERRVLAYNPNFTSVKGSKVKINYQAAGAKYKGETKNHCPKYWTKKVTWAINSKAVDEYYAKYYRLPAGIKAVERKKTIRISEVGDA